MPDYNSSFDKLRELELRRNMRQGNMPQPARAYQQRRYPANTLGPQEDVMEERRVRRQRVVGTASAGHSRRSGLGESFLVLLALIASVAAVYWFCMQQLTQ